MANCVYRIRPINSTCHNKRTPAFFPKKKKKQKRKAKNTCIQAHTACTASTCFSLVLATKCLIMCSYVSFFYGHRTLYTSRGYTEVSASIFEPCHEKTNILVSDLVRHKPGCTATEDG